MTSTKSARQTKGRAQTKDTIVVKLLDKVSKQLLGVWVKGKITRIKLGKGRGRSSKMVPRYVLDFEDKERTQYECGHDEVVNYITAYQTQPRSAATGEVSSPDARALIGSSIFTMWTVNLNHLAGGGDPPEWFQKAKMQDRIWLRKCKIAKYHTPLSQYELHYTCGYIRFVTYDAMQEFLRLNKGYKERQDHPKIRELIGYAQTEWDASKLAGETVANGQTESEAAQANDIAGSEVVATSEDQQGKDAAGPNAEGQTESKVADAESEAAQATNIPGSEEVSTSVDQ